MANFTLANMRTRLEALVNLTGTGDAYIGATLELDDINIAYEKTAYSHWWPHILRRSATVLVANVNRYALPTGFRKFRSLFSVGDQKEEVEVENIKFSQHAYAIERAAIGTGGNFVLSETPTTAPVAYTISGALTAGNSVTVTLDTVSGITAGDEIWINATTVASQEFTRVQSVNTTNKTITVKLANNQINADKLYRTAEIAVYEYYQTVTLLSAPGDVTALPDSTDYTLIHYAAYLYLTRLEEYDRAEKHLAIWKERVAEAFISHDVNSTGAVGQFVVS